MPSTFAVTGITTTSSSGPALRAGDTLTLTLATAQSIDGVTLAGGVRPILTLSNGATATYAGYDAAGLRFTYTVAAGQDTAGLTVTDLDLKGATVAHASVFGFGTPTEYAAGAQTVSTYAVFAADVNGDGKADLVTANTRDNTVSVFLGNGNGTFQAKQDFATGNSPRTVVAADVDNDGKLDLVTADTSGSTANGYVSVLLGNGDGTFRVKQDFATGAGTSSAIAVDVNQDGKLDLVTTEKGRFSGDGTTVSVLLGNGDGTFQARQTYTVGNGPQDVKAADVNGDGKTDLVVANGYSDSVSVLLGNGDGTFQAKQDYAAGPSPFGITLKDVNGDGILDIVTPNLGTPNGVSVLLGNGNGTFQARQFYATNGPAASVSLADVNGDGKVDIVASTTTGNLSILLGNGDGTFQTKRDYGAGANSYAVTTADLNGDGLPDIASASLSTSTLAVRLNTSTQALGLDAASLTTAAGTSTHIAVDTSAPVLTLALTAGTGSDPVHGSRALPTNAGGSLVLNAAAFADGLHLGGTVSDANPGPGVRIALYASDGHSVPTRTATLSGGAYTLRVDASGTAGGADPALASALTDGTYVVVASTEDALGNAGFGTPRVLIVDTTADAGAAAALTLDATADGVLDAAEARAARFTVTGLDSDASAVATFTDGTRTATATIAANGAGTVDLTGLTGTVTASLAIADIHGNTAAATGNAVQVLAPPAGDTTPPALTADVAVGRGVATPLTGHLLANDTDASPLHLAEIRFGGATVAVPSTGSVQIAGAHGTLTVSADGSYSYQAAAHGGDVFTQTVLDAAGNAGRTTLSLGVDALTETAFRFFNTVSGDHMLTTSAAEAVQIAGMANYRAEGTSWASPDKAADTTDVFRFFNVLNGDHFYTTDAAERDVLLRSGSGYAYEGVAFQAYAEAGASGTQMLSRFLNTQTGQHHLALADEAAGIRQGAAGAHWIDEGNAFVVHTSLHDLLA